MKTVTSEGILKTSAYLILLGFWRVSRLALGAEVGAAVTDNYPLNGGAADGTEVATQAVGNLKLEVSRAQCPIGAEVIFHAGSFIADS